MADNICWHQRAQEVFNQLIEKTPVFLRPIAKDKVSKKALSLVLQDKRLEVTEKDVIDAFFAETPFGFHGPMKTDMESIGVDYTKYGYSR